MAKKYSIIELETLKHLVSFGEERLADLNQISIEAQLLRRTLENAKNIIDGRVFFITSQYWMCNCSPNKISGKKTTLHEDIRGYVELYCPYCHAKRDEDHPDVELDEVVAMLIEKEENL